MKIKQYIKRELKKSKPIDWFKAAAIILMIYCGLKLFMLFYLDFLATMILTASYLKSQGKTELSKQLPHIVKWSMYYVIGLFASVMSLISISAYKEKSKKIKRR